MEIKSNESKLSGAATRGFRLPLGSSAEIKTFFERQGILIAFIVFLVGFSLASDRFMTADNVMSVLRQTSIIGTIAVGVTIVVIGGNLDLSVGSMLSFSTVLVVDLHDKIGPLGAILVMLFFTLTIGCLNGFLVGFLRLNSLIVTLGMLSAIQGLILIYTGGQNVDIKDQSHTWFAFFGRGHVFGIDTPIIIFLGLAIVFEIVLRKSVFGRKVFAVGGNPDGLRLFRHPTPPHRVLDLCHLGLHRRLRRRHPRLAGHGLAEQCRAGLRASRAGRRDPRRHEPARRFRQHRQDRHRRAHPRLHPERTAPARLSILRAVARHLGRHHPRRLARCRFEARTSLHLAVSTAQGRA